MPVQMAMPADFYAQHSHLPAFLCMATVALSGKFTSNSCEGVFPLLDLLAGALWRVHLSSYAGVFPLWCCWICLLALIIFPEILYTH